MMFGYQKLEVWQLAKEFVIRIYRLTDDFPSKERFGLVSQINRAAISVASNIAEGNSRWSYKEKSHFIEIAYGSLMEVACQLEISQELGFITSDDWKTVEKEISILSKKLSSLQKHYKSKAKKP